MQTVNDEKVTISKELYNEIKKYYSDIFLDIEPYSKREVMVKKVYINNLIKELKKETTITNKDFIRKISDVDKSEFERLLSLFEESRYKKEIEKLEKNIKDDKFTEELLVNGIKLKNEIERLKSFPALKRQISTMIIQIKKSEISNDIKKIEEQFLKLCNSNAKFDEYENLSHELSNIIGDSYKENITDIVELPSSFDFSIIASEDLKNCFLLNKSNILTSSYGLVIEPKDNIKFSSNKKGDETLLPFDKLDKKENYIEVYDLNPIAVYAITMGEKSLSDNYQQAQKLSVKYRNVPVVEIDLLRYISPSDSLEQFRYLIDKLLDDKNVNFSKKDDEFYKRFENFYKEYKLLKTNSYDEGRIRNLFDHYIRLLSSQEVCNIDSLLSDYKYSDIETVLKYNVFMDDNIFRYNSVTKPLLERFVDKFYNYRSDKTLNKIYPGFNTILNSLKDMTDNELEQTVNDINKRGVVDCWLLAQSFDPIHSSITYVSEKTEENFKNYLDSLDTNSKNAEDEKEKLLSLKEYLSSLDEDKQQSIKNHN